MKHIVLTGVPGVGKTTLIKKVSEQLVKVKQVQGFYTEEIRQEAERVGFDVVLFNGKRGPLARVRSPKNIKLECSAKSGYMMNTKERHGNVPGPIVGKYVVDVKSFEELVLPIFGENGDILVLDEIGKMELFSEHFQRLVSQQFLHPKLKIFATIPIAKGRLIPMIENIRKHPNVELFTVTKQNRNDLVKTLTDAFLY